MEAVTAQLRHGRQPRGLSRSVQLLQVCCQEPSLLDACVCSGMRNDLTYPVARLCALEEVVVHLTQVWQLCLKLVCTLGGRVSE